MTGSYSLLLKKSAERDLRKIPKADLQRITQRIKELAALPRPSGSEKLAGQDSYRTRQGDYRVVYTVDDNHRLMRSSKLGTAEKSIGDASPPPYVAEWANTIRVEEIPTASAPKP